MKPFKRTGMLWKPVLSALAILLATMACLSSAPTPAAPSPNDVATVVQATMDALQSLATPTALPPTAVPATVTAVLPPLPPTPGPPAATRPSYVAHAASRRVAGIIHPGEALY